MERSQIQKLTVSFALCLTLTLVAFAVASGHGMTRDWMLIITGTLAVIQAGLQLWRFLHLEEELAPRPRLTILIVLVIMALIIVFGSVIVMSNLNYRMMDSPQQTNTYLKNSDGL